MLQAKTIHGEYLPCCRVLSVVGDVNERQLGEVNKSGAEGCLLRSNQGPATQKPNLIAWRNHPGKSGRPLYATLCT